MIERVVHQGVGPIACGIEHQLAISTLNNPAALHIDPDTVLVQYLNCRNAIRGINDQRSRHALGIATRVGARLPATAFTTIQSGLFNHARPGYNRAFLIKVDDFNGRDRVRRIIRRNWVGIRELRPGVQSLGWEADDRVERTTGFTQQHKGMSATRAAGPTCTTGTRAGSSGFAFKRRVDASLDSGLQPLDIGQVAVTGCCRWCFCGGSLLIGTACEHLLGEVKAAVTP